MKIFISWSGTKSKTVAEALRQWLPDVIQSLEPWMSGADIAAGERWGNKIAEFLEKVKFGIVCLTKTNVEKPWILFESGALAKTLVDTYVCPYLIDMSPIDIPGGPLAQFQAKLANQEGTFELLKTINEAMGDAGLSQDQLQRAFNRCWPELEEKFNLLPVEESEVPDRSSDQMIEEILESVRELLRRTQMKSYDSDVSKSLKEQIFSIEELQNRKMELENMYQKLIQNSFYSTDDSA